MARHRPKIDQGVVRSCRETSSWKSLALATGIYATVFGLVAVYMHLGIWWLALPIIFVIAGLQNHLVILLHEGAHHLLHPNRFINDLASDIFCAIPFVAFQINYRIIHLNHHKFSGSPERDPEVHNYEFQDYYYARKSGFALWKMLLFDLVGINLARAQWKALLYTLEMKKKGKARRIYLWEWALFFAMWGIAFWAVIHYGLLIEFGIFWLAPQVILLFPFLKLHGYGEHTGATGPTEYQRTWVHDFNPISNFFVYPIKSGYHLEHHMFPMIPWFNMMRFRAALMENEEFVRGCEAVTVDGLFFGKRTLWNTMLSGEGDYRTVELHAQLEELSEDIISVEADTEIDEQYA